MRRLLPAIVFRPRNDVAKHFAEATDADPFQATTGTRTGSSESSFVCIDSTGDIAMASSTAAVIEAPARTSSKVTDWVQQQALEDRALDAATIALTTAEGYSSAKARKYDIATLLGLRYTTNLAHVELRIHPSALQERIFRSAPLFSLPKPQKRARGLSDMSLNSHPSIPSDEEVIYRHIRPLRAPFAAPNSSSEVIQLNFVNRFPRRQPCSPPTTALAQQHDGFARFLKEHASPTHQRVTAGGRIVPASGPPPVFNVESLRTPKPDSAVPEVSKTSQELREGLNAEDKSAQAAATASNTVLSTSGQNMVPRAQSFVHGRQSYVPTAANNTNANNPTVQSQLQLYSALQAPMDGALMVLSDGSNLIVQNGVSYRVYWNGFQTVSEPVFLPLAAMPGAMTGSIQQAGATAQYSMANPYANNTVSAMSTVANGQNMEAAQPDTRIPDHVLDRLHETLRYELKKLDKHIALRSNMFSVAENADYVTQRKNLVEQLDKVRISRAARGERSSSSSTVPYQGIVNVHPQAHAYAAAAQEGAVKASNVRNVMIAGIPIKYDSQGQATGPPWDALVNGAPNTSPAIIAAVDQQKTPPSKKGPGASSILSPDAPPFVPSSMQSSTARKVETCLPGNQHDNTAPSAVAQTSSTTAAPLAYGYFSGSAVQSTAAVADTSRQEKHPEAHHPTVMARSRYGSGSWSAMDDVVPFVHRQDIAYVDDLGLNPGQGSKLYCSTVTEFQEVIRRVREQARLYGCEGGQSKDPEFDAEQDIRWAMADSSPVPLPNKMPDHIAYPRPWNWNDSAFNVRADRSSIKSKKTNVQGDGDKVQNESAVLKDEKPVDGAGLSLTTLETAKPAMKVAVEGSDQENSEQRSNFEAGKSEEIKALDQSRPVLRELSPNTSVIAAKQDSTIYERFEDGPVPARCLHDRSFLDEGPTWCEKMHEAARSDPEQRAKVKASYREIAAYNAAQAKMAETSSVVAEKNRSMPSAPQAISDANQRAVENNARDDAGAAWTAKSHEPPPASKGWDDDAVDDAGTVETVQRYGPPIPKEWEQKPIPKHFMDQAQGRDRAGAVETVVSYSPFAIPKEWQEPPLPPIIQSKLRYASAESPEEAKRGPYVRFPNGQQYNASQAGMYTSDNNCPGPGPFGYNHHRPISVPTGSTYGGNHGFLRDMLKSPRYSNMGYHQQASSQPTAGQVKPYGEAARYPWNKENLRTNMGPSHPPNYMNNRAANTQHPYYLSQDARLSKAQSSIAPSSQYAQGYLPQYPTPGNPPLSDYYVRAHTPHSNSRMPGSYYGASQAGGPSYSSRRYPQYDGSGDSPPPKANGVAAVVSKEEVTLKPLDFHSDSAKVPSGHSYAVDHLFQTIRESERKEMKDYDQKPAKRT